MSSVAAGVDTKWIMCDPLDGRSAFLIRSIIKMIASAAGTDPAPTTMLATHQTTLSAVTMTSVVLDQASMRDECRAQWPNVASRSPLGHSPKPVDGELQYASDHPCQPAISFSYQHVMNRPQVWWRRRTTHAISALGRANWAVVPPVASATASPRSPTSPPPQRRVDTAPERFAYPLPNCHTLCPRFGEARRWARRRRLGSFGRRATRCCR